MQDQTSASQIQPLHLPVAFSSPFKVNFLASTNTITTQLIIRKRNPRGSTDGAPSLLSRASDSYCSPVNASPAPARLSHHQRLLSYFKSRIPAALALKPNASTSAMEPPRMPRPPCTEVHSHHRKRAGPWHGRDSSIPPPPQSPILPFLPCLFYLLSLCIFTEGPIPLTGPSFP